MQPIDISYERGIPTKYIIGISQIYFFTITDGKSRCKVKQKRMKLTVPVFKLDTSFF